MPRRRVRKKDQAALGMGCFYLIAIAIVLWLLWLAFQYRWTIGGLLIAYLCAHAAYVSTTRLRWASAFLGILALGFSVSSWQHTRQTLVLEATTQRQAEAQRQAAEEAAQKAREAEANRTYTVTVQSPPKSQVELYEDLAFDAIETKPGPKAVFKLKRGRYAVKVRREGYFSKSMEFEVSDANRNLSISLVKNTTGETDVLDGLVPGVTATPAEQPKLGLTQSNAYFGSCKEARAAGAAPIRQGEAGYRSGLDRDGDGIACE